MSPSDVLQKLASGMAAPARKRQPSLESALLNTFIVGVYAMKYHPDWASALLDQALREGANPSGFAESVKALPIDGLGTPGVARSGEGAP